MHCNILRSWILIALAVFFTADLLYGRDPDQQIFFAEIQASTKAQRDQINALGFAIDGVFSDTVVVYATEREFEKLRGRFKFEALPFPEPVWNFPGADDPYHDYAETKAALDGIVRNHPEIASVRPIGKSVEGREIYALRLSAEAENDVLPTSIFLGCHHAREHLSVEVPLKLAQYLAENYATSPRVQGILAAREVWIVPMVNPDGAEFDIQGGRYRAWRKNRRVNGGRSFGVDLNRNYGKAFGGGGTSPNPNSDVYRGPEAFSEPETRAVRDFVRARKRATVLLSYHTFGELILWPPGYTNAPLADRKDRQVFETLGKTMAQWNGHRPMQSSQLYIAAGDTTDWAYDELKIFAFTFELSPKGEGGGGFYPGAGAIDSTFQANLQPALYLIEQSVDPYSSVTSPTLKTSQNWPTDPAGIITGVINRSALFGNTAP